jgi:hypothetical protein
MALSFAEIQERVKNPGAKSQLVKALGHEYRLRFHSEKALDRGECSPYVLDFERWIEELLPADKAKAFKTLMQFPIYTNELIKSVLDEFSKVFDSQNSSFTYEFKSDSDKADFVSYLENIKFLDKWKHQSLEEMVSGINSLIITDMPRELRERPEPYSYFLPICDVIDVAVDRDGAVIYLIAKQGEAEVLVIDDTSYRVFESKEGEVGKLLIDAPHDLGYTPVCFFWKTPLSRRSLIIKESPITSALNNLNWLLYWEIARRAMELYAAYPIDISYQEKCQYKEEKEGHEYYCEGGWVDRGQFGRVQCPSCQKNKLLGPGTHLKVPMPRNKEEANVIEALKRISADVPSMEYAEKRRDSIWDEIFYDCTGWGGEEPTKEAINEKQVHSNYESKLNVLLKLKENLEASHKFAVEAIARLRYGQSFVSADINYGTKFYLQSDSEAVEDFKSVKLAGSPVYMVSEKRTQVDAIVTKGNENYAQRIAILRQLEPWCDLSVSECKNYGFDAAFPDLFLLKSDFSGMISRFEREYGSIVDFGRLVEFKTKIERIQTKLLEYVKITNKGRKEPEKEPAGAGSAGRK